MFFVLITALGLVRKLALLYGGRPGTLGLITLMRHAVSHLALTGGMAASDSLIQQMIGHGLAAKLSARLGEGVLNGLLTARLGLAAIEVIRPLPFTALRRPRSTISRARCCGSARSGRKRPRRRREAEYRFARIAVGVGARRFGACRLHSLLSGEFLDILLDITGKTP